MSPPDNGSKRLRISQHDMSNALSHQSNFANEFRALYQNSLTNALVPCTEPVTKIETPRCLKNFASAFEFYESVREFIGCQVFSKCDEIEKVIFKSMHSANGQPHVEPTQPSYHRPLKHKPGSLLWKRRFTISTDHILKCH